MQGTQSTFIPDMTEPSNAVAAYRSNEAVLAAMDDEEAGRGRPTWLRHWCDETRLPSDPKASAIAASNEREPQSGLPIAGSDPLNGHQGQSIEAAFAYDAIFQFETELEAEGTDDWLDLSSFGATPAAENEAAAELMTPANSSGSEPSSADSAEVASAQKGRFAPSGGASDRNLSHAMADFTQTSTPSLDPKAIRAAIFRLAQDSPNRRFLDESLTAVAPNPTPARLSKVFDSGSEEGRPLSQTAQAEFAEIARRVWESNCSVDDESTAKLDESLLSTSTDEPTQLRPILFGSAPNHREVSEATESSLPGRTTQEDFSPAPLPSAGAVGDSQGTDGADQTFASQPEIIPRPLGIAASTAPALAHDAGNLLSALKLYSELLALSGVLQARHSHYAEDLKLLAARSEVLIHRLLQYFTSAQDEGSRLEVGVAVTEQPVQAIPLESQEKESAGAGTIHSNIAQLEGHQDRKKDMVSSLSEQKVGETDPVDVESQPVAQTVRYWTEERLGSIGDSALQGAEGVGGHNSTIPSDKSGAETPSEAAALQSISSQHEPLQVASPQPQLEETVSDKAASDKGIVPPVNLVELLTRWGSLLSMIARSPVQISFGPNASLPVKVEEQALERILVNLVHNAMTATRDGGSIRIGVGRSETRREGAPPSAPAGLRSETRMVLTVDDSGCGMNERQVARLLGNDLRGKSSSSLPTADGITSHPSALRDEVPNLVHNGSTSSTSRPRGHGMGMQIVRELVASSGGELAIYSRLGAGTRIEIRWPLGTQKTEAEDRGLPSRIPPVSTSSISPNSALQASRHGRDGSLEGAIAC